MNHCLSSLCALLTGEEESFSGSKNDKIYEAHEVTNV